MVSPIAEQAEQVYVFQRTPQWISPRDKYGEPVEPEVRWLLDNFPGYWNWWRYMAIAALFGRTASSSRDPEWQAQGGHWNPMNDKLRDDLTAYIKAQTGGDQSLIDELIPDYAPFSRRPVVDNGWYQALTRDNVELVTDSIAHLTARPASRPSDGTVLEVDVIVTATGFDIIKYLWPAEYRGKDGLDVHDSGRSRRPARVPRHDGAALPQHVHALRPQLAAVVGRHRPADLVHGLVGVLRTMHHPDARRTAIPGSRSRREAYDRYNAALDIEASDLLLMNEDGNPEKNYYVNEFGRLQVNAPWYGPEFHRMCTQVDWNDIEIS